MSWQDDVMGFCWFRVLLTIFCIQSLATPVIQALHIINSTGSSDYMIYSTAIEPWFLWLGLVAGIVAITATTYWFQWQDYQMKNNKTVSFDVTYAVAAIFTTVLSVVVAWACVFHGVSYVFKDTIITEPSIAIIIAFAIGGAAAFLIDGALFHPIADGRIASIWVKTQKEIEKAAADKAKQAEILNSLTKATEDLGIDPANREMIDNLIKLMIDKNEAKEKIE